MKAGHFIIIGLVLWILLSTTISLWVFQSNGHIGAAIIVGLGSIIWLTNPENRQRLRTVFSSKGFDEHFLERLLNSLQVGLITFPVFNNGTPKAQKSNKLAKSLCSSLR